MRVTRLYTPLELVEHQSVTITGQAAHHVIHVLRLGTGSAVQLFDGRGTEHCATIMATDRSTITLRVAAAITGTAEPELRITLLQGVARHDHMDIMLQKAVELGVTAIQPLWMQRSQHHLKGSRLEKRVRHWRGIIINACEQCGRATLPDLLPAATFTRRLESLHTDGTCLMLDPGSDTRLNDIRPADNNIYILVGPEGGLTSDELQLAGNTGFTGIRLGPRVLRTETAAMAAITCVQMQWGDLG